MIVKSFQELIVWQKSMELAKLTYFLVKKLPNEELFSLSNQMRRAAVSIPSNIAEGQARKSKKEFKRFLSIAKGSAAELQTQLLLCVNVGYLTETEISQSIALLHEIAKMIPSLSNSLNVESNKKMSTNN